MVPVRLLATFFDNICFFVAAKKTCSRAYLGPGTGTLAAVRKVIGSQLTPDLCGWGQKSLTSRWHVLDSSEMEDFFIHL
jgi:hypothetical protein